MSGWDCEVSELVREFRAAGVTDPHALASKAAAAGLEADHSKTSDQSRYFVFRGIDAEMAKCFLLDELSVDEWHVYFVVETADGIWGRDINGLYLEQLRPWQLDISAQYVARIARIPGVLSESSGVVTAARGIADNFVVELVCGNCRARWWDGVRYQDRTAVRCPICRTFNAVDANMIHVEFGSDGSSSTAPPTNLSATLPPTDQQLRQPGWIATRLAELVGTGLSGFSKLTTRQQMMALSPSHLDSLLARDDPAEEWIRGWVEIRAIGHQLDRVGGAELMRAVADQFGRADRTVIRIDGPLTLWRFDGADFVSDDVDRLCVADTTGMIDTIWDRIGGREPCSTFLLQDTRGWIEIKPIWKSRLVGLTAETEPWAVEIPHPDGTQTRIVIPAPQSLADLVAEANACCGDAWQLFPALTLEEKRWLLDYGPIGLGMALKARKGEMNVRGFGVNLLERLSDNELNEAFVLTYLSQLARVQSESVKSIGILQYVFRHVPFDAVSLMNIGALYSDVGDRRTAVAYLEKSLELDPGNARIRTNLAIAKPGTETR
ncbi:tetratricopeptide repeat protein [Nocardia anaemiae]|uniref:tetratricopeptide repeat protein n=1 Tax=Nocardia anaemiae TaxID=263910 RepID=UPI0007A3B09C|nr:hypothetical protein [Nocardia anaemiae]